MTGCPGVDKVEFTIFSKNVFDSPTYVWTKEGSVEMIEMEVSQQPKTDTTALYFRLVGFSIVLFISYLSTKQNNWEAN